MPVQRIKPEESKLNPKLVQSLARELQRNQPKGPPNAPRIIEESFRYGDFKQVTVIWDAWKDIAPEDRGRIIVQAYEKVEGREGVMKITLALGLTHQEAQRLGLAKT